jgi:hypothetical protein
MMMLNQMKKEKTKRKKPKPDTEGGTMDHFGNKFKRQKVRKQTLIILSLEIH